MFSYDLLLEFLCETIVVKQELIQWLCHYLDLIYSHFSLLLVGRVSSDVDNVNSME